MINGMLWIGNYNSPVGEDHVAVNPNWVDTAAIRNWTAVGNWVWTPSSTVVTNCGLVYNRNSTKTLPFDSNVSPMARDTPSTRASRVTVGFQLSGCRILVRVIARWGVGTAVPCRTAPTRFTMS